MERLQMNMIVKALGLAACFLLAGCSPEQPIGEMSPLEVEAEIPVQTKAGASGLDKMAFVDTDSITVTKSGGTPSAVYKYDQTNDRWLPKTGTGLSTTGGETFVASWKPVGFTGIVADQTSEDKYKKCYELAASSTATANLVKFKFAPVAAKITIIVSYALESTEGSASLKGNKLISDTDTEQTISFHPVTNSGKKHTFVGLVHPDSNAKKIYKISVSSKNKEGTTTTRSYEEKGKTLQAGYNYIYNFSTDNKTYLILNSITVVDFVKQSETSAGDAT
ncbi:fimbrillin family protein [Parabacteroides sp.]